MRKDFTPQVETREIADSDLDNVSGGILGEVVQSAESALPALPGLSMLAGAGISGGAGLQVTGPVPVQTGLSGFAGI
ncbi:type A2 lantipeptide [Streptantibioticus ferralitis]|uniref:Type A2 lantipeptide n=1 Tax=Streptantibioticus ferralitis TaxID=236510 RepID=A0ABT5YV08_9ACTN|nr:type A2 lantipeptide [Streptantibioticus ferralitis]MDF2255166.1 type A2 lantipeptide [Streptantibioticus ferralitis]